MPLFSEINQNLKEAMRNKDQLKVSVLRMLVSAVKNKEIEKNKKKEGLSDEEILDVVISESKKRQDAVFQYESSGRKDLSQKEKSELEILKTYLPATISSKELEREVQIAIKESGAVSQKDFGKAMKILAPKIKGRADSKTAAEILKLKLQ